MRSQIAEGAVLEFQKLLGVQSVIFKKTAEELYGTSTLGLHAAIPIALKPHDRGEVIGIIRIASKYKISLYPISTGNNWGYGSANPVSPGSVVVDLSQLNRIIAFDKQLGLVTLEPGVTQSQLRQFLDKEGHRFLVEVTGGGGGCSIIGNALERGHGASGYVDRFDSIRSLEVVLADGTLYRSSFADQGSGYFKWGTGPYLDGLFAQSNLGIVVSATIALTRKSERIEVCALALKRGKSLRDLIDVSSTLLSELGDSVVSIRIQHIALLSTRIVKYPKEALVDGMIPESFFKIIAKDRHLTDWFVLIAIRGNRYTMPGVRTTLRKRMWGMTGWPIIFWNRSWVTRTQRLLDRISFLHTYARMLRVLGSSLAGAEGATSSDRPGRLPYWKLLGGMSASEYRAFMGRYSLDPDDEARCGLIFYSGVVALKGASVEQAVESIEAICRAQGFDPLIGFSTFTEHSLYLALPLLFDRQNDAETKRAHACYRALAVAGNTHGYPLYRAGIHAMDMVVDMDHPFWQTAEKIKKALDPDNIMSPGRYSKYKAPHEDQN